MDSIEKVKQQIKKDEERIAKLQSSLSIKKNRLKDLENAEILADVKALSATGIEIKELIQAINSKDNEAIIKFIKEDNAK